jgi:hypothetical protein
MAVIMDAIGIGILAMVLSVPMLFVVWWRWQRGKVKKAPNSGPKQKARSKVVRLRWSPRPNSIPYGFQCLHSPTKFKVSTTGTFCSHAVHSGIRRIPD